ncbi:hypothetical protein JOC73_002263 [Alkaliphilus hydrothermalis]|uniref:Alkyl hydroperoxide reductase subunit C/ Thiol specific antioxidant domain-containing protein n=1 Tax=Alkaliphilus hydrothermalis TaxID=1482730 RepID=A0ABS2NRV0_9FIRM|nr:hypothetical protein [Alkaliphilus hydrothermalis]
MNYRDYYHAYCYSKMMQQPNYRYIHPGETAPPFTLEGVYENQPITVNLRDYLGKWVVLFFYGSNFTFV